MAETQKGNQKAYEELLDKIYSYLQRHIKHKIYDIHIAEDLIQNIVIAVHSAKHTYNPKLSFINWLLAIAQYKTIDFFRQKKEIPIDESSIKFNNNNAQQQDHSEQILNQIELENLFKNLNEKQQDIVKKVKLEGYSIKEAANTFKLSESNIKTTIYRALKNLRRIVK